MKARSLAVVPKSATYDPALDGIRALAVVLVFLFHALPERFPGGDIGVDVFFVLSGFLLTRVILQRGSSGVREVFAFWAGRARRVWPALAVALVGGALVATLVESGSASVWAFEPLWAATFLYNWYAIGAAASPELAEVGTSPFLPLWTLAVEEQFYLFWPLLLLGISRGSSRAGAAVRVSVFFAVTVALSAALAASGASWAAIQWSSVPRFAELALGGLVAILLHRQARAIDNGTQVGRPNPAWSALVWLAGLSVCLYAVLAPATEGWTQLLSIAFCATAAGALILGLQRCGRKSRAIWAWRPAVAVGVLSYGLYLWQVPALLLVSDVMTRAGLANQGVYVSAAGAVALMAAAGSYLAVEAPFRRQQLALAKQQARVVTCAALLLVIAALVSAGLLLAASHL